VNWGGETREAERTMAVGLKTKMGHKGKKGERERKRSFANF
jgi:hypothetical protein